MSLTTKFFYTKRPNAILSTVNKITKPFHTIRNNISINSNYHTYAVPVPPPVFNTTDLLVNGFCSWRGLSSALLSSALHTHRWRDAN